jgi:hypothetical protein
MPTEFRFEDLDLREEPARGDALDPSADGISTYITCNTGNCNTSRNCSAVCCD